MTVVAVPGAGRRHAGCAFDGIDLQYSGDVATTRSGHACQEWASQSPNPHPFDIDVKQAGLALASNFCRNPDGRGIGPWCFIKDRDGASSKRLEECDVCERYYHSKSGTCKKVSEPCNHPLLYERRKPTATSDRECALLSVCQPTGNPSTEETQAPTYTSDRVCGPRKRKCEFGREYRVGEPLPSGERLCRVVTTCSPDEYEIAPPSLTSNRICRRVSICGDRTCSGRDCPCGANCHECILPAAAQATAAQAGGLASTAVCKVCKNSAYLFNGQCHDSCQAFTKDEAVGVGNFGRRCGPQPRARYIPEYELIEATPTSDRACRPRRPLTSSASFLISCNYEGNGDAPAGRVPANSKLVFDVINSLEEILGYNAEHKHQGFVRSSQPSPNQRINVSLADTLAVDRLRDNLQRFVVLQNDFICRATEFLPVASTTPTTSITSTPTTTATTTALPICGPDEFIALDAAGLKWQCVPKTYCRPPQYTVAVGTPTSDRVCGTCASPCKPFEYESQACTTFTNRQCKKVRQCNYGQFVKTEATPSSDRVCSTCSEPCTAGEYEAVGCKPFGTSDRMCTKCAECAAFPHRYEKQACSRFSDTVCVLSPPCQLRSAELYESRALAPAADRQCTACSECPAEHYEIRKCGAPSVPPESAGSLDRQCSRCTVCGAKEDELKPCTALQNRECVPWTTTATATPTTTPTSTPTSSATSTATTSATTTGTTVWWGHYSNPGNVEANCLEGEKRHSIGGIAGAVCAPRCLAARRCPKDTPFGITAQPKCIIYDPSAGGRANAPTHCALVCKLGAPENTGDELKQCPTGATCKQTSGRIGICTYDVITTTTTSTSSSSSTMTVTSVSTASATTTTTSTSTMSSTSSRTSSSTTASSSTSVTESTVTTTSTSTTSPTSTSTSEKSAAILTTNSPAPVATRNATATVAPNTTATTEALTANSTTTTTTTPTMPPPTTLTVLATNVSVTTVPPCDVFVPIEASQCEEVANDLGGFGKLELCGMDVIVPGGFCLATTKCGTQTTLSNCASYSVYQREVATGRNATTDAPSSTTAASIDESPPSNSTQVSIGRAYEERKAPASSASFGETWGWIIGVIAGVVVFAVIAVYVGKHAVGKKEDEKEEVVSVGSIHRGDSERPESNETTFNLDSYNSKATENQSANEESDIYRSTPASDDTPAAHSISEGAVGSRVTVLGYGAGVLKYYGRHATKPGFRCGIELSLAKGKHNGTVDKYVYFRCTGNRGVLVDPRKVTIVGGPSELTAAKAKHSRSPAAVAIDKFVGETSPSGDAQKEQLKYLQQQMQISTQTYGAVAKKKPGELCTAANNAHGKNRYADVLPYDTTRVVLDGPDNEDYINASRVALKAHTGSLSHICCQGPTPKTVAEMWKMVLQENVELIVMLAQVFEGGRQKCEQYWPEEQGQELTFGQTTIKTTSVKKDAGIVVTKMSVKGPGDAQNRTITHLQFTGWPDHGVPQTADSLLKFIDTFDMLTEQCSATAGPPIVHCSAGVGRTGVFMCVRILIDKLRSNLVPDMKAILEDLRRQRMMLVQTLSQYEFCIQAAVHWVGLNSGSNASDSDGEVNV